MRRLAWFSPFPPVRTGVAACSAELVAALRTRGYEIDAYPEGAAHDFPWRHRRRPYDLVVYQFGNSSHHDYEWAYALRYPGLVVLHDTRLHHARAAFLLRERRADDYRAEFRWNHPEVAPDAAELAVAGFDSELYYEWGMVKALVARARLVGVHGEPARRELLQRLSIPNAATPNAASNAATPNATSNAATPNSQSEGSIVSVRLGHGEFVAADRRERARRDVRATYAIPGDAVLFGCFGGITPEKRVPQILAAMRAIAAHAPDARLLLAGAAAAHYDVRADIAAHGLENRVTIAGYIDSDAGLTDHLAACDVSLNLRWPTARETSGPWLRALAAGVATVITDLVHLGDVSSLDPRTWTENRLWALGLGLWEDTESAAFPKPKAQSLKPKAAFPKPKAQSLKPISVAIDILDEDHSLRLAMKRLATDAALREQLARAGQAYWQREHTIDAMVEDYERLIAVAAARPDPAVPGDSPIHLHDAGDRRLRALLEPFGVGEPF